MKKYIIDRFLTPSHLIASCGIAFSGQIINNGFFSFFTFLISFLGVLLFFLLLRIDDDLQDLPQDKIAFKDRVSLKKLKLQDIEKYVLRMSIVFNIFLYLFFWKSGILYSVALLYFWIQRKHFREPILNHFVSEGLIIPISLFSSEMGMGASIPYALVLFGAFSTYEICRKLDPFAHPAILSLLQFYGFKKVYWIVAAQLLISAIGAYYLNSYLLLWPAEIGVLYVLSRLYKTPREFRFAQIAAGISLLIHIWFA